MGLELGIHTHALGENLNLVWSWPANRATNQSFSLGDPHQLFLSGENEMMYSQMMISRRGGAGGSQNDIGDNVVLMKISLRY